MAKIVEHDDGRMYRLWVDDKGDFYLAVVVGGIAMYDVTMKLNEKEVDQYKAEGKTFIDDLAYRLAKFHGSEFRGRLT